MNRNAFLKYLGSAAFTPVTSLLGLTDVGSLDKHRIKPPRLKKGGTIGLVSPASIIPEREKYAEIQATLRSLGFNIKVGTHALDQHGYFAGKDILRAADLNAMFADDNVDAIIPFRGGWGSNRILDLIDFEAIRGNPKPLVGFSDITSLLLAIYAQTGLITFHGPVGKSEWTDFTFRHFQQAVMRSKPISLRNPDLDKIEVIQQGTASGPILGGNLTVLTSMLGSGYLPNFSGAILFLEDVGEDVYRIDRMLTQLKLNGILDQINGLLFGECTNCEPGNSYSLSLREVLHDHIKPLQIPACYGARIGHIEDMFTIPVGVPATLDANSGSLEISESAVSG